MQVPFIVGGEGESVYSIGHVSATQVIGQNQPQGRKNIQKKAVIQQHETHIDTFGPPV